jgi:hypothetical protein
VEGEPPAVKVNGSDAIDGMRDISIKVHELQARRGLLTHVHLYIQRYNETSTSGRSGVQEPCRAEEGLLTLLLVVVSSTAPIIAIDSDIRGGTVRY